MKKITSRQLQALTTKTRLMEVALDLIIRHGYSSVTIQQICAAGEVSTGAFYHHFKNKPGILIELYSRMDAYFQKSVYGNLQAGDPCSRILEYMGEMANYAVKAGRPLLTEVYRAQMTDANTTFLSPEREFPAGLLRLVTAAQREGALSAGYTPQEIRDEILLIARGTVYHWCQATIDYDLAARVNRILSRYLHYYQTPQGDTQEKA